MRMELQTINQEGLDRILQAGGTALIEFGAVWCAPCRALLPILEELGGHYGASLSIAKVDVDQSPELASAYGIMSMPTVIVFQDGHPVEKLIGLRPKNAYQAVIDRVCHV